MGFAPSIPCAALVAFALAACAPLPITYYQPVAEDAKVVWARCDQAPPYMAQFNSAELNVTAKFDGTSIVLGFYPRGAAKFSLDTTSVTAEADGAPARITGMNYSLLNSPISESHPAIGTLKIETEGLFLRADIEPKNPKSLELHIPQLGAVRDTIPGRTVRFNQQRKVKLRFLIINC
jgi:hypothetical protein